MKFCPVEAKLLRADGQTNITKLIVAICNFANAPKNARTDKKLEEWGLKPCLLSRETIWVKTNEICQISNVPYCLCKMSCCHDDDDDDNNNNNNNNNNSIVFMDVMSSGLVECTWVSLDLLPPSRV